MKVKELMKLFVDNYQEIRIETPTKNFESMKILYVANPNTWSVPEYVEDMEISMIGLFHNGLSIVVTSPEEWKQFLISMRK